MEKSLLKYFIPLMLVFPLFLFGCQQDQEHARDNQGRVTINDAYAKHFGTLPPFEAGRAYAHVGYLPLKETPDKVAALPIFLFSTEDRERKVLQKLISGDLIAIHETPFLDPFPDDLELIVQPLDGPVLVLDLRTGKTSKRRNRYALVNALKETALQFEAVERVKVLINGAALPDMPDQGYIHDANLIAETQPPTLLQMAGAWEGDQGDPAEILIEFDRPVKVNSFNLLHQDGSKVEGDYYTSIFHMAVVIHPQSPKDFQAGTILKAQWNIEDFKGRTNSGANTLPLVKLVH